jgi:hypothetical protein
LKLDPFHWMKRFNDILVEPNKEHARIFRARISKALFNVSPDDYEAAKETLFAKNKRYPTVQEIKKEA